MLLYLKKNPSWDQVAHKLTVINAVTIFGGFYLLDSIALGIFWVANLHDCDERICFTENGCHAKKKKAFYQLS